ncbi:hypothetical protein C9439_03950 [archaeon SCG-AAA382B04]|nr:hypothetical protein C9439_03950 [archaeon SCG-AAA382B04]
MAFFENKIDAPVIIHYLQPHRPWLIKSDTGGGNPFDNDRKNNDSRIFSSFRNRFGPKIANLLGYRRTEDLRKRWGLTKNNFKAIFSSFGAKKSLEAYETSLTKTLRSVENLTEEVNGRIVVTSDHGEAFGENGVYGHGYYSACRDLDVLREVPWLWVQ